MRHKFDTIINSFNCKEIFFNSTYNIRSPFEDIISKFEAYNTNNIFENHLLFSKKISVNLYPEFVCYKKEKTITDSGKSSIHFFLEYEDDKHEIVCVHCGHAHIPNSAVSSKTVTLKDYIPMYDFTKCTIRLKYYRCPHCNKLITREIPFRVKNLHITYRLLYTVKNYIFDFTFSNRSIAKKLNISKNIVNEIYNSLIVEGYKDYDLTKVKYIGIDEHSIHKGHKYVTIVVDLETKAIIYVCIGKKKGDVQPFFDRLKELNLLNNIIGFSCDCSSGYISMAQENLPNARIVLDEFHVLKMLSKAFDSVRMDVVCRLRNMSNFLIKQERQDREPSGRLVKQLNTLTEELIKKGLSNSDIDALKVHPDKLGESKRILHMIELINKDRNLLALGLREFENRVKDRPETRDVFLACPEFKEILLLGDAVRRFWHQEKDSTAVNGRDSEAEKVAYVLQAIEQVRERFLKFKNVKMQNFAKFFKKHADHIAYASVLDFHLSNSVVEGINSQAKHLQRVHKGQFHVATYICLLHQFFPGKAA